MEALQDKLKLDMYDASEVINADETGIFYGEKPKYQYVPDGTRGSAPESDEKARFTAMLWGSANGVMSPPFIIFKSSGIASLRKVFATTFKKPEFLASMENVFVEVGQWFTEEGTFKPYISSKHGSMIKSLVKVEREALERSIASLCADVATRAEAEEDGNSAEDSSEDDADNDSLEEN
ncbi:MAG: hypothetical protein SGPRY_011855 [Prymnesium sp.]